MSSGLEAKIDPARRVVVRRSLRTGALVATVLLAFEALALLPGRITIGHHQAQYGRSPTEFAIAGTLRDLSDLALPLGGTFLLVLALALFATRRTTETKRRRVVGRTFAVYTIVIGVVVWLASSSAAEFKIQRGVDATRFDIEMGARNTTLSVRNILAFILLRRHWVPLVAVLVVTVALAIWVRRRYPTWSFERAPAMGAGFVLATVAGWALALVPLDPHVRVFRTLSDRHIVGEPFVNLVAGLGRSQENVRLGLRGMIEHASFPADPAHRGEALLGLPVYVSEAAASAPHPMARRLPELGLEHAPPGTLGYRSLSDDPAHVVHILDELSAELYDGRKDPIDVWQLLLESFRGDDIHAISKPAPRELAPFVGSLYEAAEKGDGSVIAVHRMWQAGARTSQGFSAYLCGMGMMPYGLSVTRDFGSIPLRCLPDVLGDAGFEGSFFYGGPPSFDEMDTFLREHGVRDVTGRLQLPSSLPTSEGGVSDRALFVEAARHIAKLSPTRPHYALVMSGSNHVPYGRPEDLPAVIDERVNDLAASPAFVGAQDDLGRLRTFAYADLAVSELFTALEPRLDRSIIVLGADHATGDPFVWQSTPEWNRHAGLGLIPFVIVLPEPLIAKSARPERVRELVRDLNRSLAQGPWSQNDVPAFLLALLGHAPGMLALPASARWHTIGGERTSPFFAPPHPDVKVIGIDCVAGFFGTDAEGHSLLPPETASFVTDSSQIYTSSPTLLPVAGAFSRFLNGYASTAARR
jgi:hypothetical protein